MACVGFALLMLMLSGALTAAVGTALIRRQQRAGVLRQLAKRMHGRYVHGSWFESARVTFRYGESYAILSFRSRERGLRTFELRLDWPDRDTRLAIVPTLGGDLRMLGSDVKVDDPVFDRTYRLVGHPRTAVRAFASPAVRWQIDKIRNLAGSHDVRVMVSGGQFVVEKAVQALTFAVLESLTTIALDLYDQALLTRSTGIEFIEPETVQVVQQAMCQVCSEDIVSDMVLCRRCKTPHHLDCWQYYGACTTYGCGETVYQLPQVARPQVVDE